MASFIMSVSIPDRYSKNKLRHTYATELIEFQFLIGTLKTTEVRNGKEAERSFNS